MAEPEGGRDTSLARGKARGPEAGIGDGLRPLGLAWRGGGKKFKMLERVADLLWRSGIGLARILSWGHLMGSGDRSRD